MSLTIPALFIAFHSVRTDPCQQGKLKPFLRIASDEHTLQVSSGTERPPNACDDSYPQGIVLVEKLPDFCNFLARSLVDAIELLRPCQCDLKDPLLWKRNFEVLVN